VPPERLLLVLEVLSVTNVHKGAFHSSKVQSRAQSVSRTLMPTRREASGVKHALRERMLQLGVPIVRAAGQEI